MTSEVSLYGKNNYLQFGTKHLYIQVPYFLESRPGLIFFQMDIFCSVPDSVYFRFLFPNDNYAKGKQKNSYNIFARGSPKSSDPSGKDDIDSTWITQRRFDF